MSVSLIIYRPGGLNGINLNTFNKKQQIHICVRFSICIAKYVKIKSTLLQDSRVHFDISPKLFLHNQLHPLSPSLHHTLTNIFSYLFKRYFHISIFLQKYFFTTSCISSLHLSTTHSRQMAPTISVSLHASSSQQHEEYEEAS